MDSQQKARAVLKNLPNKLTLVRIIATPVLLLVYPLDFFATNILCTLIFIGAALTDYFDGYLARKYQAVTPLGSLLDPIADKMLIAASLVLLAHAHAIPAVLAGLMICRDIGVSGLRLMAQERNITIAVSDFGKWKTALQAVAIACLLVNRPLWDLPLRSIGMLTMWAALGLSIYSAWAYGRAFWEKSKDLTFS